MSRVRTAAIVVALATGAAAFSTQTAHAQMLPLGVEVRGGFNFAINDLKNGLGDDPSVVPFKAKEGGISGGGDLYWTFHRNAAVYLGYSASHFECTKGECGVAGHVDSMGPEAGFKFSLSKDWSFTPWGRVGVIAHQASFQEGDAVDQESNRTIGLEAAVGTEVHLSDVVSLSPAVHFYRYNAPWDIGSIEQGRVNRNLGWFQADLGLILDFSRRRARLGG